MGTKAVDKQVVTLIGYITNDIDHPKNTVGGIAYNAVTAQRLGYETNIVTKCSPDDEHVQNLTTHGINVHVLPSEKNTTTTFENIHLGQGKRLFTIEDEQEPIREGELRKLPSELVTDAAILVATFLNEVEMKSFGWLAEQGKTLGIAPQGYFREIDRTPHPELNKPIIKQVPWEGFEEDLEKTTVTLFSNEDITINGIFDEKLHEKIITASQLAVMTEGENGVIIYQKEHEPLHVGAFGLVESEDPDENEVNKLTGAGDVFATVFFLEMTRTNGDIKSAAVTANFFAAIKIMGFAGTGIDSIPTEEQRTKFITENRERVDQYFDKYGVKNPFA